LQKGNYYFTFSPGYILSIRALFIWRGLAASGAACQKFAPGLNTVAPVAALPLCFDSPEKTLGTKRRNTVDELFIIVYKLTNGKRIRLEVTSEVKELLEQSDRQIRSQRRQDRRHLEKEEYEDGLTDTTIVYPHEDFADLVIKMDSYKQLYAALEKLSVTQRRRLRMRFFERLTYRRIAEIENVSHKAVEDSIIRALKRLKAIL